MTHMQRDLVALKQLGKEHLAARRFDAASSVSRRRRT